MTSNKHILAVISSDQLQPYMGGGGGGVYGHYKAYHWKALEEGFHLVAYRM